MANKRKFDPSMFGFSEEEWAKLDEQRKIHFRSKAYYQRNSEKKRAYQRDYDKVQKEKKRVQSLRDNGE